MSGSSHNDLQRPADDEVGRLRKRSEVLIELATSEASHEREQGASLLRWAMTTCLTINAGALIGSMNAGDFDPTSRVWAGVWFLLGLAMSLLASVSLASAFLRMAHTKLGIAKDLKLALQTDDLKKLAAIDASRIKGAEARGGFAFFLALLSTFMFMVGAGIMIEGAP